MSFVYESLKLTLLFIKIPNSLFTLALALKIKSQSKYILNYLFYIAFICWSVYIGLDGVLYIIAPNGEFAYTLANIMRDLGVLMLAFTPLCFILASFIIKEGEEIALQVKKTRLVFTFVVSFSLALIMILTDTIVVRDLTKPGKPIIDPSLLPPTGAFRVTFDSVTLQGQVSSFFILAFVAWYIASVLLMFIQQSRESGAKKIRTRLIMTGMLMIPAGICYFILLPYVFPASQTPNLQPWFNLAGQLAWATSPVLVFLGMRVRVPEEEKKLTVPIQKSPS
ncbi:MAG: hypothetical protein Q6373_000625 [Candidatus Sigynarchaeota archaeon]